MTRLLRSLWYALQLRCEEAERLMQRRRDDELTWSERNGLRVHLAICRSCRATRRRLEQIVDMLRDADDAEIADGEGSRAVLADDAKDRLRRALRRHDER
ncbi:MAG: zf-HC2 domain-containing protein [Phycisphaerae bacterium]|nr:zf-HC2 domain-containing protein [Phycisphaerae bacterium]